MAQCTQTCLKQDESGQNPDIDESIVTDKNDPSLNITFYDVLNDLKDYKNLDVYVTGSNSKMLSSDIVTNFRQIERSHIIENIIYNELIIRGYSVDVVVVAINKVVDGKKTQSLHEIDFFGQ